MIKTNRKSDRSIISYLLIHPNNISYRWQDVKNIPAKGLLLSYDKRNRDKIARIITVAPTSESYQDGAKLVSENTKIANGHLAEPECDRAAPAFS